MVAGISAALYLGFQTESSRFLYLVLQPYGTALCLGMAGLVILEMREGHARGLRLVAGGLCLLAAFWVNAALVFTLGSLILFRWYFLSGRNPLTQHVVIWKDSWQEMAASVRELRHSGHFWQLSRAALARQLLGNQSCLSLLLVFLAFIVMFFLSGSISIFFMKAQFVYWPYPPDHSTGQLLRAWIRFGSNIWKDYLTTAWGVTLSVFLALGFGCRIFVKARIAHRNAERAALILVSSSFINFIMMGSLTYVKGNLFASRYALASLVLVQIAAVIWALLPIYELFTQRWRDLASLAALAVLFATAVFFYGFPSPSKVRADIDRTLGKYTAEVVESQATHIVGNYWNVWPMMFHTNLVLYENGSQRKVWGVTVRSNPTRKFWSRIPEREMRLAALIGDPEAAQYLRLYSFPPVKEERRFDSIVLLRPAGTVLGFSRNLTP